MEINEIISSGILECYVLGKTTDQETQQVLAWKGMYPEVAAEILAIEDSLEQLDFAQAVSPSASIKNNLLEKIKVNPNTNLQANQAPVIPIAQTPIVSKINNSYKYAAAAAAVLLIGAVLSNIYTYSNYKKTKDALALAEQKIKLQNEEIAAIQNNLDGPLNSNSQQVVLKGTPTYPSSTAKIFWIKSSGDVFVEASGLPAAPSGMQYQLWAIIDDKPVDAGMIVDGKKGQKYNIQKMKSFGKAQAFAITLEKAGGSATPTMEKLYVISKI